MRADFVALILKFQSLISATDRRSIFRPERAAVEKIRPADLLKIHLGVHVELDPQVGKSSCERSCLTPILQDKKRTDDQNQNTPKFF